MVSLHTFLADLTDPVTKAKKFLWKELPGDYIQLFGKSLDIKAHIKQTDTKAFNLTLIIRDGSTKAFTCLKSIENAKSKAEEEYSSWIRATALIELN